MGKAGTFTTIVALTSLSIAACAKDKKTDQMEALDNALKAGVLTKDEYEAKKAALRGATIQENARPPAATKGGGTGNYFRLKKVKLIDEHGFERPIPAMSVLIPADWKFQGGVRYLTGGCGLAETTFRASGPDGRSIEMLPDYNWQWSDDAFTNQSLSSQRGCPVMRPMGAGDFLKRVVLPKVQPGARLVAIEPIPKASEKMKEMARQTQAASAQAGLQMKVRSDVARARLQIALEGHPVEEWVTAAMLTRVMAYPTYNIATMQPGQAPYYGSWAQSFVLRAPQGQLDASEKLFEIIISTIHIEPDWQNRVNAVQNNIAAAQIKGAADRSKIISKSNAEISKMIVQGHEERSKSMDRTMANYSQALRGVESYRNPNTGETFELSNQYGHAWVNNNNEYILSDKEGFNPNVELKTGNWTALERVKPR